jgi:hypothetical protein
VLLCVAVKLRFAKRNDAATAGMQGWKNKCTYKWNEQMKRNERMKEALACGGDAV